MSILNTITKINKLLLQIKYCLKNHQQILPLIKCARQFNINDKKIIRTNPTPLIFSKGSITVVLRIVEILTIVKNLLLNNKFITKRNLYYQLVKYYKNYPMIDDDVNIICDSLKIERSALNIIVSSKLQLFWFNVVQNDSNKEVALKLSYKKCIFLSQQIVVQLQNKKANNRRIHMQKGLKIHQPTQPLSKNSTLSSSPTKYSKSQTAPSYKQVHHSITYHQEIIYPSQQFSPQYTNQNKINFLIMQKQSIFQILTQSLTYKLPSQRQNWLLINSKGYPDMTTLHFISQIFEKSQNADIQFYYIGDFDVYGMDIMLNYAIGNQYLSGLWKKLKWLYKFDQILQIENNKRYGFRKKFQQSQYRKLSLDDSKKSQQILNRRYFDTQALNQVSSQSQYQKDKSKKQQQIDRLFIDKTKSWRDILQNMIKNGYQCEAQSYFKHLMYPFDLIELMVERKLFI